ncbi:hypothetical protein Tco_0743253 [Tanacetum coccineum]
MQSYVVELLGLAMKWATEKHKTVFGSVDACTDEGNVVDCTIFTIIKWIQVGAIVYRNNPFSLAKLKPNVQTIEVAIKELEKALFLKLIEYVPQVARKQGQPPSYCNEMNEKIIVYEHALTEVSISIWAMIALSIVVDDQVLKACKVVLQLKKALEFPITDLHVQCFQTWEPKLPRDDKAIIHMSLTSTTLVTRRTSSARNPDGRR